MWDFEEFMNRILRISTFHFYNYRNKRRYNTFSEVRSCLLNYLEEQRGVTFNNNSEFREYINLHSVELYFDLYHMFYLQEEPPTFLRIQFPEE